MKRFSFFILLLIVFVLVPIGLLTDAPAWGEWDLSFFEKTLGFVPEGIKHSPELIKPVIPDYTLDEKHPILSYYISAFVGVGLIFLSFYILKVFIKNER